MRRSIYSILESQYCYLYFRCISCGICVEFCPKDVLAPDDQGKPIPENIDACIKCSLCELRCPDFAITVEGVKEKDE